MNMIIKDQNVSKGSSHLKKQTEGFSIQNYMISNMQYNAAYVNHILKNNLKDNDKKILDDFKQRYSDYRNKWLSLGKTNLKNEELTKENTQNPLCVDIETASICDLACPHCYREYIITPDKIMDEKLYKKIIDQIVKMKVPSIKLNWRGEPLMNPKITEFIKYAKKQGILEVSINSNATHLNKKMAQKILDAGLDILIFSFDGGTRSTYEKMRPGRFKENKFEEVLENIKNFSLLKKEKNKIFPLTKIQMVLTKSTREEVEPFFKLIKDYIDDVTVTQYQERGGNLSDLQDKQKEKIQTYKKSLSHKYENFQYIAKVDGSILVSTKRLPCEQLHQRMMVTFDGKVGMCCHDWGAKHCIGYLDKKAFNDNPLKDVEKKINQNKKGFELLSKAKMPKNYNNPDKKVSELKEIWSGEELNKVRELHSMNKVNDVEICKGCTFKNSYEWEKI